MSQFVTGLVLAAGGSKRLGQPKQLLPYGSGTLLDGHADAAVDVPVAGAIPPDINTWEDYEARRA